MTSQNNILKLGPCHKNSSSTYHIQMPGFYLSSCINRLGIQDKTWFPGLRKLHASGAPELPGRERGKGFFHKPLTTIQRFKTLPHLSATLDKTPHPWWVWWARNKIGPWSEELGISGPCSSSQVLNLMKIIAEVFIPATQIQDIGFVI